MSGPYMAEIRLLSFNFAPRGWASCNGQQLPINQNQALFSLLGTVYGGNGVTTFGLPDLRGRMALHTNSSGYIQGDKNGAESANLATVATQVGSSVNGASVGVAFGPNPTVATMMPYLTLNFAIALVGAFPSRN